MVFHKVDDAETGLVRCVTDAVFVCQLNYTKIRTQLSASQPLTGSKGNAVHFSQHRHASLVTFVSVKLHLIFIYLFICHNAVLLSRFVRELCYRCVATVAIAINSFCMSVCPCVTFRGLVIALSVLWSVYNFLTFILQLSSCIIHNQF